MAQQKEQDAPLWRELQRALQAPIAEEKLSWRPLTVTEKNGGSAKFAPYIDDAFLEDRLDDVLGMPGWSVAYDEAGNTTKCKLSLDLGGLQVDREGIGFHEAKGSDPSHKEHGARTKAFRDACRRFGICGRDVDGAQTGWVKCTVWKKGDVVNVDQVLQPLTRALLSHSGASLYKPVGQGGNGKPGRVSEDTSSQGSKPVDTLANSRPGANEADSQLKPRTTDPTQTEQIIWPFPGKFKNVALGDLQKWYLEGRMKQMKELDPDSPQFDQFWYDAVVCAISRLDVKKAAQSKQQEDTDMQQVEEMFDGEPF